MLYKYSFTSYNIFKDMTIYFSCLPENFEIFSINSHIRTDGNLVLEILSKTDVNTEDLKKSFFWQSDLEYVDIKKTVLE